MHALHAVHVIVVMIPMQRPAARDDPLHDPLLGHGDPYGQARAEEEELPTSTHAASTPAAPLAGTGSQFKDIIHESSR